MRWIKLKWIYAAVSCMMAVQVTAQTTNDVTSFVNPIIGTNGMGHTFPGACYPFGLVQLSPDTDTIPHNIDGKYQPRAYEYCAGYQYKDSSIVGFSHTHFSGTGHSDLGDILIIPTTGKLKLNPGTALHALMTVIVPAIHTKQKYHVRDITRSFFLIME